MMENSMILPALATFSVIVLILGKLYSKIRSKFPTTVNCWFCNSFTSVPYNSGNSWYCPQCDQYNGFSPDGSYNRFLPEQFNEKLNYGSWAIRAKQKRETTNGLCRFCNINLELKVQQLAHFVPLNKDNYDEEVQLYSDQLERVYRLCSRCQGVLENTIKEKQEKFVANQHHIFQNTLNHSCSQPKEKERHSLYLNLTALLSAGLLISSLPLNWASILMDNYPPPEYISHLITLVQEHVPGIAQSLMFLTLGVLVQLCDCFYMRDMSSFVNLLLWLLLLSLSQVRLQVDGLVSTIHMMASIVFFITSITERKVDRPRTVAAVKPVQFHEIDEKNEPTPVKKNVVDENSTNKLIMPQSAITQLNTVLPDSYQPHEPSPEDFGFGKLNVSSRRVTRSQTKHFQAKVYRSQTQTDLFRPKPVTLTPPKLQLDISDYQVPLTRSSSQSSGFVSMSHQKDFEEYRSPSVVDNIDSVSQCGRRDLIPYHTPFMFPSSFSTPSYGVPFSHFQPYTVMNFSSPHFNKVYDYPNLRTYESSLNFSTISMHKSIERVSWFQHVKNALSSLLILFLVTSNVAILWKVFGEDYFKPKT